MNILPIEGINAGQVLTTGRVERQSGVEDSFKQALSDVNELQLSADTPWCTLPRGNWGSRRDAHDHRGGYVPAASCAGAQQDHGCLQGDQPDVGEKGT